MPKDTIPFGALASGLDELAGAPPLYINVYRDAGGSTRRRPGIATWADFPETIPNASPVVGMTVFGDALVYVTLDRKLFAMQVAGTVSSLSNASAATQLDGSRRPSFAATRDTLIIAGGGAPQKWDVSLGLTARLGGSPPVASHVVTIAQRVVLSRFDLSGQIQWTPAGLTETWNGLDFAEAEARPDVLVAIAENTNELYAFGASTTQVFAPDASVIFAPGRTLNEGCGAPDSVIRVEDTFAWLGQNVARRFVMTTPGGGVVPISTPVIDRTLQSLGAVSDTWGFRAKMDAGDFLVWVMPTEARAFVYEIQSKSWGEWRSFAAGDWTALTIQSYCYWPAKNLHLVGLSDGSIARLDAGTSTEKGATLKGQMRTGFTNRGTDAYKDCRIVRLAMKRGAGTVGAEEPSVELSWRDDQGAFGDPVRLGLGYAGDGRVDVQLETLGTYREREWQLDITDSVDWSMASATETFDVLEE